MPLFRKQSAAEQTSLAPHDSKARLLSGRDSQGFMAKPCTPHLHCAARAALQAANPQCRGSRGPPLAFLWGIQRGYSLRKENTPFGAAARTPHFPSALCAESNRSPEGAQKRSSPFGLPLFYFSQMTGFWRSDSTKALAFSTASARGSFTCSPVRMSLQDTTPALISSSPRK